MRKDPLILVRPETESVKVYQTHARMVKEVRHELLKEKQEKGVDIYRFVREQKELRSVRLTLTKAENKYPGLLRHITRSNNGVETAVKFGITRSRVSQIKQKMKRFATLDKIKFQGVWTQFHDTLRT